MHRVISPEGVQKPASNYAQAVEVSAAARRLVISGQVGLTADGTLMEGYEGQAERAWTNVLSIVAAAGMKTTDIVKVTVFDAAPGNLAVYRAMRDRMLAGHAPACTYIVVSALASPGFLTEIEAEAVAA